MPKEVIHLTFGTLAHHTTTHFFNQQSSHFQYSEPRLQAKGGQSDDDNDDRVEGSNRHDLILDPYVDFQEGIGRVRGEQTFFPRQVVIDFRDSLGTRWEAYDIVFDEQDDGDGNGRIEDEEYGILRPSRAANEGLHAWGRPAEIFKTYDATDGLQSTRLGYVEDDEDAEEVDYETDDESTDVTTDKGASKTRVESLQRQSRGFDKPSAYSHNPLHPRSARPLPALFGGGVISAMASYDSSEGRTAFSTFEMGVGLAKSMEKDESFLDENLRWFAEDSDQLQSISMYASVFDGFSGFAHEMVQVLADEFPKTPVLSWGLNSSPTWHQSTDLAIDEIERLDRLRMTNRVLSLWSLSNTSLHVPLSSHTGISQGYISSKVDWSKMRNAGALYAAHIDTATMSTRLYDQDVRQSVSSLVQSLNWRRNTPIAVLGGALPTPLLAPIKEAEKPLDPIEALLAARGYDPRKHSRSNGQHDTAEERAKVAAREISRHFSYLTPYRLQDSPSKSKDRTEKPFAQVTTARDSDPLAAQPTRDAMDVWSKLDEPVGRSTFVPLAYNVRSATFPNIFTRLTHEGRPRPRTSPGSRSTRSRVDAVPMLSSLSTSPDTAHLLSDARKWIDEVLVKGHTPLAAFGIGGSRGRSGAGQAASDETEGFLGGREGLVEIREALEELLGSYEEGLVGSLSDDNDEEGRIGTDEEFAEAQSGSDWDLE